ncbi:MAG: metal ABC transporter ATP-binding protein [Desulfovermiculus sp.]
MNTSSTHPPVIDICNLSFAYHKHWVLEDVNLKIQELDFVAVIGPNGGGKTTLLKIILGLLTPTRGEVRIFGLPPHQAVPDIGYVPQDTEINPSVPMTVEQAVLMGCMRGGGGWHRFTRSDQEQAEEAMLNAGVQKLARNQMADLSGGQRQRVMLARALVSRPRLLLLDEPTANIDTQGQGEFYDFLQQLNARVTIVVVSHDLMVLSTYIKSVVCVSRQVHFHDQPEVTSEMLSAAYHCPVELVTHGRIPHRVLARHEDASDA